MQNLSNKYAVAAIRVSTTKQGTDGDSPEAQKEQIERFAQSKGIVILRQELSQLQGMFCFPRCQ